MCLPSSTPILGTYRSLDLHFPQPRRTYCRPTFATDPPLGAERPASQAKRGFPTRFPRIIARRFPSARGRLRASLTELDLHASFLPDCTGSRSPIRIPRLSLSGDHQRVALATFAHCFKSPRAASACDARDKETI